MLTEVSVFMEKIELYYWTNQITWIDFYPETSKTEEITLHNTDIVSRV